MKKNTTLPALIVSMISLALIGCGEKKTTATDDHGHPHDDHGGHDNHDHGEETDLGSFKAGELEIQASQSHGNLEAGKEGHLVINLPYKDDGATVVRAWIGSEDRTLSQVGKGVYAASHGDYDIHTMAPAPLPADAQWWVEIEKPDGTKLVGSIAPKM